jgi:formylglycine-generating enzyme required for sulfatase activity
LKAQNPDASKGVADCEDGYAYTAPVGSFRASAFGLHDMLGNVWEWVEDVWHDSYYGAPADGSAWIDESSRNRVARGGSWNLDPRGFQLAIDRSWIPPDGRGGILGFRVARTLD